MISSIEYEILISLSKNPTSIDEIKKENELSVLLKEKLINYNVIGENNYNFFYNGFIVTPNGYRAIEEFENLKKSQNNELENLKLSKKANIKSLISIIISIISLLLSTIFSLLPYIIELFQKQ